MALSWFGMTETGSRKTTASSDTLFNCEKYLADRCCSRARVQRRGVAKTPIRVILSRHGVRSSTWESGRLNEYSSAPWPDWGVPPGDLTAHGRKVIELLGAYYRQRFLHDGLLGDGTCREKQRLYVWADTDQRTLATGRAFADSIFPGCDAAVHSATASKDPVFRGLARIDPQTAAREVLARLGPHPEQVAEQYRPALKIPEFILDGGGARSTKVLDTSAVIGVTTGDSGVELQGPFATASTLSEDFLLEYADGMSGPHLGWGRLQKKIFCRLSNCTVFTRT